MGGISTEASIVYTILHKWMLFRQIETFDNILYNFS